ncbi:hypothetical protein [Natronomonas moolapensis]|nr:hypothetical protein [Natronomonas moolapensis]
MEAEDYIDQLIETEREGMNQRAKWISEHRPQYSHGMSMFGGEKALTLYEDSQLSYIYGTFSGSILLSQSFIEQSICAMAHDAGEFTEDDLLGYHDAVNFLTERDIVDPNEVSGVPLDELHNLRNPVAHFRDPSDEDSLSRRKVTNARNEPESVAPTTNEMLKDDAEKILKTVFSVATLFGVGYRSD